VFATIKGPAGTGTTDYFVHASAGGIANGTPSQSGGGGSTPRALIITLTGVLAIALVGVAVVRRRRLAAAR
jgi:hypothetical protein